MPIWKALLLTLYYHASLPVRQWTRRRWLRERRVPVAVLFYHRIADDDATPWTMSNRCFEEQMSWLSDHLEMIGLSEAQRRIRAGVNDRPAVSVTFDDGYAENCQAAIPLLVKKRIPCTYFVTAQSVLEGRLFPHDLACGCRFMPNSVDQLRAMAAAGIEIGSHTYSHPDLGPITDYERLHYEVVVAGQELQAALDRPMRYFAFPFGMRENLNRRVFEIAHAAGYEGVCSAYGGMNFPGDDAFHIHRLPADPRMIRLKNAVTGDPRKSRLRRYEYSIPTSQLAPTR